VTDREPRRGRRRRWNGPVTIGQGAQGLQASFDHSSGVVGKRGHLRYDMLRARFSGRRIEDAYVIFQRKPDGSIDQVQAKPASPPDLGFDEQDLEFTPDTAP
jgi:hypothetical protein